MGKCISLSGDGRTVATGASGYDAGSFPGYVKLYRIIDKDTSPSWKQLGDGIDGEADDFVGKYLSLSENGNIVAVGSGSASVRVFHISY